VNDAGRRTAIIGGGVLGMTLALRLKAAGVDATIIEASPALGGLASSDSIGGYRWDRFYHVILQSDRELLGLLGELGLQERLRWSYARTACFANGRFHPLSTSVDFLRFPPLGLVDKARLAATVLCASRIENWRELERETAADWLLRWSGRRTYERLWLPLLRSKLGDNAPRASAAFIWAIIARMYAARRSGLKREMFGYVEGGYDVILPRFRQQLQDAGVEFLCGSRVTNVTPGGDGVWVRLGSGAARQFDDVILTVPCGQVRALCPGLTPAEVDRLGRVVYQGIVCPSLLLRRPLGDRYITSITDSWVPFTAVIEMTALVDRSAFGGQNLVYLPRYLTQESPMWERSDEDILAEFTQALTRMYPGLRAEDIVASKVARARDVLALSTLHYSRDALPPLQTSLPGVFIVNSAQIAAGTLNVNETVALANRQAAAYLRAAPARALRVAAG
jgi:protoporphyrinogen oxidase